MQRSTAITLGLIVVVVVAGGIFLLTKHPAAAPASSPSPSPTPTPVAASKSPAASTEAAAGATVTYSASGFSPSSVSMKAGDKFTVKNASSSAIQVDSNPHPVHTNNTQLNIGSIAPGSSASVALTKTGTWGYHNHLAPDMLGTVVVK